MDDDQRRKIKETINSIREILFRIWDPLNVAGAVKIQDEYDSYIGPVLKILEKNPTLAQISSLLREIETKQLRTTGSEERISEAALSLKTLSDRMRS